MRHARRTVVTLVASLLALAATVAVARADELAIAVLSNRADLISAGDALVEVIVPPDVTAADVHVSLNATDVTGVFGLTSTGRFVGLVTGLAVGDNVIEAHATPPTTKQAAAIVVTNHAIGGPVFAGEQLLPFICARTTATPVTVTVPGTGLSGTATTKVSGLDSDPVDDQCNAAPKITYFYQPATTTSCTFTTPNTSGSCFVTYNLASPPAPADIANFTNDRGDTVKSIIKVERGTVDRGIYDIVSFFDPTQPSTPQNRQHGWNGKLLWSMGAASGPRRFEMPPTVSVFNANALSRGFMIASGSLTDHDTNSNDTLAAEFLMMIKEHVIESYGEIRYTIGTGCSGGSILQYNIAAAYPGLLNGIQPNCTFPDTLTTAIEVVDCGLLNRYYGVAPGNALSTTKRAAINGHANNNQCSAWVGSFLNFGNPTIAGNCGSGFPTAITYDPVSRRDGVRCTSFDHDASMLGTFIDPLDGNKKVQSPIDNVGVQYGLKALAAGTISAAEFVDLNEKIGSYTADLVPTTGRATAIPAALDTAYTAGLVTDGKQLAKTAIIDLRGNQGAVDIHLNWRALEVRARLDKANGNHDNQVIWASGGAITPGAAQLLKSFLTMDQWLRNIELDTSNAPIETKVVTNKPAAAHDLCIATNGATDAQAAAELPGGLSDPACPVLFQSSPHQVAGGPRSEDVFKCQLKPLDFASPDYNGVVFDSTQQARLTAAFPSGVCDYTMPGVGQVPSNGPTTFENGPGGEPLGPAPESDTVPPVCGDGDVIGETCDDGNTTAGDGCSATCAVEAGWQCTGSPSVCTAICGDGLVRDGEACDDGNTTAGDGCSAGCTVEIGYTCPGEPSVCAAICGDALVRGGEACDDGNTTAGDGCSTTCTVEAGFTCPGEPSVCAAICGDGLLRDGEACDDGNTAGGDGCSATCTVETGFACSGEPSACDGICGDGLIRGTEACDDAGANGSLPSCCAVTCQLRPAGTACTDGNACTTSDACSGSANSCVGGAPPNCDDLNSCTADSCNTSSGCVHDTAARDGFSCDDDNPCTQNEVCAGGVCTGPVGGDSDGDGYCDAQEVAAGCNPNDDAEIPPQAVAFGGKPVNGDGNLLVTFLTPANDKVLRASDPSCAAAGTCGPTGFCTAGKVADHCATNADCDQAPNTCRVVANYAETADLAVRKPFTFNKTVVTPLFEPLTPGCSRKVDLTVDPAIKTNKLKINVTGTAGGHARRDADYFRYR